MLESYDVEIVKSTHGFTVRPNHQDIKDWLKGYVYKFYSEIDERWSYTKFKKVKTVTKVLVPMCKEEGWIGFPIKDFENLHADLNLFCYHRNLKIKIRESDYTPVSTKINFEVYKNIRDLQKPVLEYLKEENPIRTVPLPTGQGKTLSTFFYLETIQERTVFFFKKEHLETWKATIKNETNTKDDEFYIIDSTKKLRDLNMNGVNNSIPSKIKFILIPSSISHIYIKKFVDYSPSYKDDEIDPLDVYGGVPPNKFLENLGVGVTVTDEAQQLMEHVIYRAVCFNVKKNIYLSATLGSKKNRIKDRVHNLLFPKRERFTQFNENDHIEVEFLEYHIEELENPNTSIRYMGTKGYSHNAFEASLMRPNNKHYLDSYFNMVYTILKTSYLDDFLVKTKALVLFSTQDMCTRFKLFLEKQPHPNLNGLSIKRYIAIDPPEHYQTGDIVISTTGSMGVGKDVPNLRCNILTKAIGEENLFIQVMGRTRPIKDYPHIYPTFTALFCKEIQSHQVYMKYLEKDVIKRSRSFKKRDLFVSL